MTVTDAAGGAVSIVDVARRAGVSASTVSRSMRGGTNVAPATRKRVLQAARELAYVPSPAASQLASGHTGAVGVIVPFSTRWFFAEAVAGAERALREAGLGLLLYNIGEPAGRAGFFASMPLRRRVDAVLAIATSLTDAERSGLAALRVPIVAVGQRCAGFPRVGVDDGSGAAAAVRHLVLLGHRDIAMITGLPDDAIGAATTSARRAGFEQALEQAGIAPGPDRVVAAHWGVRGGVLAMERLLTGANLPTAVVAESDEMAFGAMQAMRRSGLDVPGDVSLVGFDDHEMAAAADLTTIAQPVQLQGELAARLLLDALDGAEPGDVVLPTRLVVRGSTGPPRTPTA